MKQLFDEFVRDRRAQLFAGYTLEDLGYLLRYTPQDLGDGWVTFSCLDPSRARSIIGEQIAYFRSRHWGFEWKLYEFDKPDGLKSLLVEQGFVPGEQEAFMVYAVTGHGDPIANSGPWEIVRIESEQGVRDVVAVQQAVWNREFAWLEGYLLHRLLVRPEQISIYCAYLGGRPVGTGWTDFPTGSKFAELHGGAVLQELRGQGIYWALYGRRLDEAADRGYAKIAVDASPMSRPILERMGFAHVCDTTPMSYRIA